MAAFGSGGGGSGGRSTGSARSVGVSSVGTSAGWGGAVERMGTSRFGSSCSKSRPS